VQIALADVSPLGVPRFAANDAGAPALGKLFDQFMSENLDRSPIFRDVAWAWTRRARASAWEVDDQFAQGHSGRQEHFRCRSIFRRLKAFRPQFVERNGPAQL